MKNQIVTEEELIKWGMPRAMKIARQEAKDDGEVFSAMSRVRVENKVYQSARAILEMGDRFTARQIRGAMKALDTLSEIAGYLDVFGCEEMTRAQYEGSQNQLAGYPAFKDKQGVIVYPG